MTPNLQPLRILYRADGGHPIGTGHMWRAARILKALASLTPIDARLLFAEEPFACKVAESAPSRPIALPPRTDLAAVKPLLQSEPILAEVERESCDIIVIDMLDTPEPEMAALRSTGIPIVTFDDRGAGRFFASAIVNILIEEPDPNRLRIGTRLFEGGEYAVLDPMFAGAHDSPAPRTFGELRRLFVAMGGADAAGLTVKVGRALRRLPELDEVRLVCGPAFPHAEQLDSALSGSPWRYSVLRDLPGLLDEYRWCDAAVIAGGLTMYEVCCVGVPALSVCQPIDHQLELSARLSKLGALATAGWGLEATEEEIAAAVRSLAPPWIRKSMADRGPQLVDGRGASRVAEIILDLARK